MYFDVQSIIILTLIIVSFSHVFTQCAGSTEGGTDSTSRADPISVGGAVGIALACVFVFGIIYLLVAILLYHKRKGIHTCTMSCTFKIMYKIMYNAIIRTCVIYTMHLVIFNNVHLPIILE